MPISSHKFMPRNTMAIPSIVNNMLELLRPRNRTSEDWIQWLLSKSAPEDAIHEEIVRIAGIFLPPDIGGPLDAQPFGLNHKSILQILGCISVILSAEDNRSVLAQMIEEVGVARITLEPENKEYYLDSTQTLICASMLIAILDNVASSSARDISQDDWTEAVEAILSFEMKMYIVLALKYKPDNSGPETVIDEKFQGIFNGLMLAHYFAVGGRGNIVEIVTSKVLYNTFKSPHEAFNVAINKINPTANPDQIKREYDFALRFISTFRSQVLTNEV